MTRGPKIMVPSIAPMVLSVLGDPTYRVLVHTGVGILCQMDRVTPN